MSKELEVQPTALLNIIVNSLNQFIFKAEEKPAQALYEAIRDGKTPKILSLDAESGRLDCTLEFDFSEHVGEMDFDQFRKLLASHLYQSAEKLKNKEEIPIFTSKENQEMIFHVPGVNQSDDQVNIMVSSIRQESEGLIAIRLMCLDPNQFSSKAAS